MRPARLATATWNTSLARSIATVVASMTTPPGCHADGGQHFRPILPENREESMPSVLTIRWASALERPPSRGPDGPAYEIMISLAALASEDQRHCVERNRTRAAVASLVGLMPNDRHC